MSGGRDRVLGAIRRALGRGATDPHAEAVAHRLATRPRGPQPARAMGDRAEIEARFQAEAERATVEVIPVARAADVPRAVADYAARRGAGGAIRVAPSLRHLGWDVGADHNVLFGDGDLDVRVGVSAALCGIAETGSVVLASGVEDPIRLAFVAEFHVAVLARADIVGGLDEAMDRIRGQGLPPRAASFVTGPSRTGDIEMTLQFGAHGPRHLAIIIVP